MLNQAEVSTHHRERFLLQAKASDSARIHFLRGLVGSDCIFWETRRMQADMMTDSHLDGADSRTMTHLEISSRVSHPGSSTASSFRQQLCCIKSGLTCTSMPKHRANETSLQLPKNFHLHPEPGVFLFDSPFPGLICHQGAMGRSRRTYDAKNLRQRRPGQDFLVRPRPAFVKKIAQEKETRPSS